MLKDIVVFVDPSEAGRRRLQLAVSLAAAHGAHLSGVHVIGVPKVDPLFATGLWRRLEKLYLTGTAEVAQKARAMFEDAAAKAGISHEWRESRGDSYTEAVAHARYCDLAIVGQIDPDWDSDLPPVSPESVALGSGRPVLVVPYAGTFTTVGRSALIAWSDKREGARAVGDALPLMKGAAQVVVMTVEPDAAESDAGADLAAHLARHGLPVTVEHSAASDDVTVADILLGRAADLGSDLLVMGAYGRPRASEVILGGVTRQILQQMTLPVLMAH